MLRYRFERPPREEPEEDPGKPPLFERPYVIELLARIEAYERAHPHEPIRGNFDWSNARIAEAG